MAFGPLVKPDLGDTTGIWQDFSSGTHNIVFDDRDWDGSDKPAEFVILHLEVVGAAALDATQQVTIDLKNGQVDTFDETDGQDFWTRPIACVPLARADGSLGPGIQLTITAGRSVHLIEYGHGIFDLFMKTGDHSDSINDVNSAGINGCDQTPATESDPGCDPRWQPITELPAGSTRRELADKVGMLVYVRSIDPRAPDGERVIGHCTAALFKENWVITSAHCIDTLSSIADFGVFHENEEDYRLIEIESGSFTPDYNPQPVGVVPAENDRPKFYKLTEVERTGFRFPVQVEPKKKPSGIDYIVAQLRSDQLPDGPLAFEGIETVDAAADVGDELFIIHHPRGRTKRISQHIPGNHDCQQALPVYVGSDPTPAEFAVRNIVTDCDLDSGSSGAPVFSASDDKLVGVVKSTTISGESLAIHNFGPQITTIAEDLTSTDPVQVLRGAVIGDSSGSMGLMLATGSTKMQEAQEAITEFLELLRYQNVNAVEDQHRIALLEFDSAASSLYSMTLLKESYAPLETQTRSDLLLAVNNFGVGGSTSIGAALQLGSGTVNGGIPVEDANKLKSVLVMTDGLHNTDPSIATGEADLGNIRLHAIGFGSEASLNSQELNRLAEDHGGDYLRAEDGLALKKFYGIEYGQMLETGVELDPPLVIPAGIDTFGPIPFHVLTERSLTALIGWERPDAQLSINLITPNGRTINQGMPGVQYEEGRTWGFIRVDLPFEEEKNGLWHAQVTRRTDVLRLRGHNAAILQVAFSPDGVHLLSASSDGDVRLWNVRLGRSVRQFYRDLDWDNEQDLFPVAIGFTPDGQYGFVASRSGRSTHLLNLDTGVPFRELTPPVENKLLNVVLSSDNEWAVGAFAGFGVVFWMLNMASPLVFQTLEADLTYVIEEPDIRDIAYDPMGRFLAVLAGPDGALPGLSLVTRTGEPERIPVEPLEPYIEAMVRVVFSPDGQFVVAGLLDGTMLRISVEGYELIQVGDEKTAQVLDLAVHPDNQRLLCCYADEIPPEMWEIEQNERIYTLEEHDQIVASVALSPDGVVAVTASFDTTLIVWDFEEGTPRLSTFDYDERFFFLNLIQGDVFMQPVAPRRIVYTGDTLYPQVVLRYKIGARVPMADVMLEITRPTESIGQLVLDSVASEGELVDRQFYGDHIEGRYARLIDLENRHRYNRSDYVDTYDDPEGGQLFDYAPIPDVLGGAPPLLNKTTDTPRPLYDDGLHFDGAMEPDGVFGDSVEDITQFEGHYELRAVARFGSDKQYSREVIWSVTVAFGIDPERTEVETKPGLSPNTHIVKFFPRDVHGNPMGPGRASDIAITQFSGSQPVGDLVDNGDGTYSQQIVALTRAVNVQPFIAITQPGRPQITLPPVTIASDVPSDPDGNVETPVKPNLMEQFMAFLNGLFETLVRILLRRNPK